MSLFNYIAYAEENRNKLSSTDKAILFTIAVKCNDDGRLCCTQREVARMLEMAPSNFSRKVAQFEEMGILHRVNGSIVFDDNVVKGSMPYRKDWSDSSRYGTQGYQTDNFSGITGDSGQIAEVISQITKRYHIDNPEVISQITRVISQITPSRKEEKNKKETILNGVSDGQAAHLGYAMSAKPYRGGGRPADDSQMEQPSRVQVVKAKPQPTWWEQRANMKSFAERLAEERERFNANKPTYTTEQEAFLSVYPKAPGDPVAFILAWEDVIKQDVLPKELVNAAGIASNSPAFKENGGQYIPKPENWLAGKGWAQTVEPWRAKRKQQAMQEDANLPPPDLDFDPFCKDLQDVVAITSDMPVPFNVRDTSYWEPNESELIRLRAVSAIEKWVTARNNKLARTKQPLIDAAREVLNFFLIQERTGEKPYIPSNRIAWLNTNVIRVSPEEILTPEQAICLARQDLNR